MRANLENNTDAVIFRTQLNDNFKDVYNLTGVTAPTNNVFASITKTGLYCEAKAAGTAGDAVEFVYVANSTDDLACEVTGSVITIKLAKTTGSKNTATLRAAIITATPAAIALVRVYVVTAATEGVAFAQEALTGGVDGTVGYLGQVRYDASAVKWECVGITNVALGTQGYFWEPQGFPGLAKYPTGIFVGTKRVFKQLITGVIANASGTVASFGLPHKNWKPYSPLYAANVLSAGVYSMLGGYYNTANFSVLGMFEGQMYVLHIAGGAYVGGTFTCDGYFYEDV